MTTITLTSSIPTAAKADVLTVGVFAPDTPTDDMSMADDRMNALLIPARLAGGTGKVGEVTKFPAPDGVAADAVIAVGLGKRTELTAETVRRAAGSASRAAVGHARMASTLGTLGVQAAAEGHVLGAYQFTGYKSPTKPAIGQVALHVAKADRAAKNALRTATVAAEAVSLARDFVNTAPNDLPPAAFADRAAEAARAAGLTVQVLTEKSLERGGYGGILGVGAGSSRPPRLVRITYRPSTDRGAQVALVGKGITFDSGGLSLKPPANMDHMTSDMAGAAAVVATIIAASALELPISITATVPMAENLPSGSSYRPGDVLTHRGGQTVHVLNTDAEGRLVLADAIVRACEDKPDYLFTAATLTGAQVVALGNRTMGVMGTDELRDRVAELAREVGEGGWAMPLPEELREGLDSPLADIANVSSDRAGGMLVAGHYLKHFVPNGMQWAHLDVAGPAFNSGAVYGYTAKGGTGVPVRTLIAALTDIAGA